MGLSDIRQYTWYQNNKFKVELLPPFPIDTNVANNHIANISIPDIVSQNLEEFHGNQWHIANGRPEVYLINITFWESEVQLYTSLLDYYEEKRNTYPRDLWFDLRFTRLDRKNRSTLDTIIFKKCLMTSISNTRYDELSPNMILQFSINIKSPYFEIENDNLWTF